MLEFCIRNSVNMCMRCIQNRACLCDIKLQIIQTKLYQFAILNGHFQNIPFNVYIECCS